MDHRSLPVLLLALVVACSHDAPGENVGFTSIDVPGGIKIETSGVRIEVADSVRYRFLSYTSSSAGSSSSATLNGHPFGLRDGVFFIGEEEYGAAPTGALVRVNDDGVFVDQEERGQVPKASPEEVGK